MKRFLEKKHLYYGLLFLCIVLIGIGVRLLFIGSYPSALNCDEASSGYEAYSLLHYGIDRNGNHNPVFLVAWGGGQNALLSYLIIPFVQLFGLNLFSIRIPMALLGCLSLFVFYFCLKRIGNKKLAILGLFLLAICPWHVMKSRWGLESNLFPDLILLFSFLFIWGVSEKKKIFYYLSFVVAGISAYSYGTSYYFLPVFLLPLLGYFVYKKTIPLKEAILGIFIVFIVSLPVILYVVINTLGLEQIQLPFMTIPKLEVNRYQEITSIFSGGFLKNSLHNFLGSMQVVFLQNDGLPWNSIGSFGTLYLFSILFTVVGILNSFKKRKWVYIKYEVLFKIWFIVSIVLMFICEPNINRLNIVWFPLLYYTVIGVYLFSLKFKKGFILLLGLYVFSFGLFIHAYLHEDFNSYGTFEGDLKEVVQYVDKIPKEIVITNKIQSSYMHVLFYTEYNTNDFVNTVHYEDPKAAFKNVLGFGKYRFSAIQNIDHDKVYVIKKEDKDLIENTSYKVTEFKRYYVLES